MRERTPQDIEWNKQKAWNELHNEQLFTGFKGKRFFLRGMRRLDREHYEGKGSSVSGNSGDNGTGKSA